MAQQSIIQPKYWGATTHEECHKANHPHDAYLKLYRKQYRKSTKRNNKTPIQKLEKTMSVLNPTINDILFDDTDWSKHFRYKHKNPSYLQKQTTETFYEWYCAVGSSHQIPKFKYRNSMVLVPITDDDTYFIDSELIKQLSELVELYYGLQIKEIDVSNTQNILFPKVTNQNNFITKDIHNKLSAYYQNDKEIFGIVGICSKIGLMDMSYKVCHGESNQSTQSAVCSFSKLGIYNKNTKNIPQWLKIRRSGKILLHELGHLFGISHCEYFRCIMNQDVVLDNVPMTLCPICLNKLYYAMIKYNLNRNTFEYEHVHKLTPSVSTDSDDTQTSDESGTSKRTSDDEKDKQMQQGKEQAQEKEREEEDDFEAFKIDDETFNLIQRYQKLAEWFNEHKLFREATWYKNRIDSLMLKK